MYIFVQTVRRRGVLSRDEPAARPRAAVNKSSIKSKSDLEWAAVDAVKRRK